MAQATKKKYDWRKYSDPFDGTPRYTFEGRDPDCTVSDIAVVITTERRRKYEWDGKSVKNFYTGYVCHMRMECADTTREFESIAECKKATEALYELYVRDYPDAYSDVRD